MRNKKIIGMGGILIIHEKQSIIIKLGVSIYYKLRQGCSNICYTYVMVKRIKYAKRN